MGKPASESARAWPRLCWLGVTLAGLAALMVFLAGPGYRFQAWGLGTAFWLLRVGGIAGAVAALLCILALLVGFRHRRAVLVLPLAGVLAGSLAFGVPLEMKRQAASVPPIHDITTDTQSPPRFHALLEVRKQAGAGVDYPGQQTAAQQRQGYPDLHTIELASPPADAFKQALAVAHELGWRIALADADAGRIEATDTTFWFGFHDDVVVRIQAENQGSRVDIRSVSRVGVSDLGKNAQRIRRFARRFQARFANG